MSCKVQELSDGCFSFLNNTCSVGQKLISCDDDDDVSSAVYLHPSMPKKDKGCSVGGEMSFIDGSFSVGSEIRSNCETKFQTIHQYFMQCIDQCCRVSDVPLDSNRMNGGNDNQGYSAVPFLIS